MIDSSELRQQCAERLLEAAPRVPQISAFVGLDGFVDEIIHVVDKRESAEKFTRMRTISRLAERLAGAAGKSYWRISDRIFWSRLCPKEIDYS